MSFRKIASAVLVLPFVFSGDYISSHHERILNRNNVAIYVQYMKTMHDDRIEKYRITIDKSHGHQVIYLISASGIDRNRNGIPDIDMITKDCSSEGDLRMANGEGYSWVMVDKNEHVHVDQRGSCSVPDSKELKDMQTEADKAVRNAIKYGEEIK